MHLVCERLDPAREAQRVRLKRAIGAALVGLPAVVDANVRVATSRSPVCTIASAMVRMRSSEMSQPKAFQVLKPITGVECSAG